MATLKALPIKVMRGYHDQHGSQGDEAPNQTYGDGALISPDANGKYAATAAGAAAATAANRIAMMPAQNSAAPQRKVEFANPNQHGAIEISALGAASSTSNIKVGLVYGYAIDTTQTPNVGYLDLTNTTNGVFRIEDNNPTVGVIGDTGVRVLATIVAAAR